MNGNGHVSGGGLDARLQKLLAHHEGIALAVRTVIAALNGSAKIAKEKTGAAVLADALALDSARRGRGRPKKSTPPPPHSAATLREQRERSRALLAVDAGAVVMTDGAAGIGSLVRHGYLRKTKAGYVRTAKVYAVDPAAV